MDWLLGSFCHWRCKSFENNVSHKFVSRKTFKRDLKNSAASTPLSLSPRQIQLPATKSASAPASPVKKHDPSPELRPKLTGKRGRPPTPAATDAVGKRQRRSLQLSTTPSQETKLKASDSSKSSPTDPEPAPRRTSSRGAGSSEVDKKVPTQVEDKTSSKRRGRPSAAPSVKSETETETVEATKTTGAGVDKESAVNKSDEKTSIWSDQVKPSRSASDPQTSSKKRGRPLLEKSGLTKEAESETSTKKKKGLMPTSSSVKSEDANKVGVETTSTSAEVHSEETGNSSNPKPVETSSTEVASKDVELKKELEVSAEKSDLVVAENAKVVSTATGSSSRPSTPTSTDDVKKSKTPNADEDSRRRVSNNVSMNEVIKLHQVTLAEFFCYA